MTFHTVYDFPVNMYKKKGYINFIKRLKINLTNGKAITQYRKIIHKIHCQENVNIQNVWNSGYDTERICI